MVYTDVWGGGAEQAEQATSKATALKHAWEPSFVRPGVVLLTLQRLVALSYRAAADIQL